jgi:hypothetical protein
MLDALNRLLGWLRSVWTAGGSQRSAPAALDRAHEHVSRSRGQAADCLATRSVLCGDQDHPRPVIVRGTAGTHQLDCRTVPEVSIDRRDGGDGRREVIAVVAVGLVLAIALLIGVLAFRLPLPAGIGTVSMAATANILTGTAVVVLVIGAGAFGEAYLAGLWAVSPLLPGAAGVGTIGTYLLQADGGAGAASELAIAIGLAGALLGWALAGLLVRRLGRRDLAQMRTYDRLCDRYGQLCARYNELERAGEIPRERAAQYETMISEARLRLESVRHTLLDPQTGGGALRWMLATGYANLMRTLHRVDEMIIVAEPCEAVIGDALHDNLSLSGSTIADREGLGNRLAAAVRIISDDAARVFFVPAVEANATTTRRPSEAEAREVLREIRFAVNDFRDDRMDGIIRARNRVLWTMVAVGITTYVALALAVVLGVSRERLAAAAAFYVVAALVGLFNRLRVESGRASAAEDYGLYMVRLVTAPLLSGLAGVAGVFLLAASAAAASAATPDLTNLLESTYDLGQNQLNLLTAAVFGLAPGQLITGLQKQVDRFQRDLEKSEPSGGSDPSSASPDA